MSKKLKTVVFGGAGFIGSHVADVLAKKGHEVSLFDITKSEFNTANHKMIVGSVLDLETVKNVINGADYVYNFSGIAGIKEAKNNPLETIHTNIIGNANILEACKQFNVKRYIFASTVYVYNDFAPFYSSSKQSCELLIEDYQKVFGLEYTILRYGSLYGPRANNFNTIKNVISSAIKENKIIHHGNPDDLREYIHVLDAAESSVDILSEEFKNQCVMLTGDQSIKVKDLLNLINEILGGKLVIEFREVENNGHYNLTPYSFKPKIAKKLSPKLRYDLGQGLLETIYEVDGSNYKK